MDKRHFISAFFLLLLALPGHAENAIQITDIRGASAYDIGSGADTPRIYGGIAGADCASNPGDNTFCNNCGQQDLACNHRRIHPELILHIDFKVVGDLNGTIRFGWTIDGNKAEFADYETSGGSLVKGSTGWVEIRWKDICNNTAYDDGSGTNTFAVDCAGGDGAVDNIVGDDLTAFLTVENSGPTFDNDKGTPIEISIIAPDADRANDLNNDLDCTDPAMGGDDDPSGGICLMTAYPGDEKVYITDISKYNCDSTFKKVRVFYSDVDFNSANYDSSSYSDLPLDEDCAPSGDWIITGLQNDVTYFFRPSIVDVANNNVFLLDEGYIDSDPGDNTSCNSGALTDDFCNFMATPGKVLGLLTKDFNCFIATAAYGSGFAPKVQDFRRFRDRILLKNKFGRYFTKMYYRYGPIGAKFISDKPTLRSITRGVLLVPWSFTWLSLHYGFSGALIFVFLLIGLTVYGFRSWRVHQQL